MVLLIVNLMLVMGVLAQEHEHHPETDTSSTDEHHPQRPEEASSGEREEMGMTAGPLGIGMEREGSGTSWQPDSSPMYAIHSMADEWELMLHGNMFLQYVYEGSDRGDSGFGLVNWIMGMASRPVGPGQIGFRAMLSAEPITVGKCGYPDLLATGEFCDGEPLHDRQHPHDVFMEVAARYQQPLGGSMAVEIYGGLAGEPALGPVAYPHRISAMSMPLATIGHHWHDASHISFGVVTAGLYGLRWKLEGSLFNGREPDDERFDLDLAPLDSYSGRVWFLPNDQWAFQASIGRLTEAEAPRESGESRADVTRATSSLTYHQPFGRSGIWASTLLWGRNRAHGLNTDAFLIESNLNVDERNVVFGRGELARKSGEDLVIDQEAHDVGHEVFTVGKLTAGYMRQFGHAGSLLPAVGAQISLSVIPSDLEPFYGAQTPVGFAVFLNLKPAPMHMKHTAPHDMDHGEH